MPFKMKIIKDQNKRQEIETVFFSYFRSYANRNWEEITKHLCDGFTMFGTAIDEVCLSSIKTLSTLKREFQQSPSPLKYEITGLEIFEITKDVVLLMITTDLKIHNKLLEIDYKNNRSSVIMVRDEGRWKLAHGHWSQPDKDIDTGESVPYRLLIERSKELEKKVAERTRKIEAQRDQLAKLNHTKDKLFSILAHDLINPFNSILGFSGLLYNNLDSYDKKKIRKMLYSIHHQSKNTFELLENLLDWAKSQIKQIEFNPVGRQLKELINEVIEQTFTAATEEKNISILTDIPENLTVYADHHMLQIILRNLINNAVKFTHPGGSVMIKVSREKSHICISVSDTGIGMDEETKSKIFDGFFNETTPGTGNEKGTGLGLVLCKEFVEKHGGRIWAESETAKGSCFYFTLPYKQS